MAVLLSPAKLRQTGRVIQYFTCENIKIRVDRMAFQVPHS